jgi:hypothetical protein
MNARERGSLDSYPSLSARKPLPHQPQSRRHVADLAGQARFANIGVSSGKIYGDASLLQFPLHPDCSRVPHVGNIGAIEGNPAAHDNEWEQIKRGGDPAI